MSKSEIKKICLEYLQEEPDKIYQEQIRELLVNNLFTELDSRMSQNLKFGTAGIRAPMQAGYNCMNLVSIFKFAFGFSQVICKNSKIIIGYDARVKSQEFAQELGVILTNLGHKVFLINKLVPTPVLAFLVRFKNFNFGIMVTASHNHKDDNGIKLYNQDGAQIIGEFLTKLENKICQSLSRNKFFEQKYNYKFKYNNLELDINLENKFFEKITSNKFFKNSELDKNIKITYTAVHGVAKDLFIKLLEKNNFLDINLVKEQAEPNGLFPTAEIPNPELPETLSLANIYAEKFHSDWIFAHDPDGDRLQVIARDKENNLIKLSGNEMGIILGYFAMLRGNSCGARSLVATSVVSSRMLQKMAQELGCEYCEAKTGFGNIVAQSLVQAKKTNAKLIFAYEEAIGFLFAESVLDKDGLCAGLRFAEIGAYLKKKNLNILDLLEQLYRKFGLFLNSQFSIYIDGLDFKSKINSILLDFKNNKNNILNLIFGGENYKIYDLSENSSRNKYQDISGKIIIIESQDNLRFLVRPSGTESKIKFYLEYYKLLNNNNNFIDIRDKNMRNLNEKIKLIKNMLI